MSDEAMIAFHMLREYGYSMAQCVDMAKSVVVADAAGACVLSRGPLHGYSVLFPDRSPYMDGFSTVQEAMGRYMAEVARLKRDSLSQTGATCL